MPAAVAIPALISGGTSLASGILGSRAAKGAAKTQAEAAAEAGRLMEAAAQGVNPQLMQAAQEAGLWATGAGEFAAQDVTGAADRAGAGVTGAAGESNALLRALYEQYGEQLAPYLQAGGGAVTTLAQMAAPGGDINRRFTMADFEQDPGYQFRLQEGQKALERSAAARGLLQSGGTLKAMTNYAQGAASQEYANAFDRFQREREGRFGMLSSLSGLGQNALGQAQRAGEFYGGQTGQNLMGAAQYAGDIGVRGREYAGGARMGSTQYAGNLVTDASRMQAQNTMDAARARAGLTTDAANARAAGQVGSANAWGTTLANLGNTASNIGGYYMLRDLLK